MGYGSTLVLRRGRNLANWQQDLPRLQSMRARMKRLLADADDEFLPATAYAEWFDEQRKLVHTALGPVQPPGTRL